MLLVFKRSGKNPIIHKLIKRNFSFARPLTTARDVICLSSELFTGPNCKLEKYKVPDNQHQTFSIMLGTKPSCITSVGFHLVTALVRATRDE